MSKSPIELGKVYTHYKGGRYVPLHMSIESTNVRDGGVYVVYLSLTYGIVHHRPLEEFIEEIEWPDGITRPRFILEESI